MPGAATDAEITVADEPLGRPHRLIRWQFERDSEIAEMQIVNLECRLKLCARSRPYLTNNPRALGKIRGGNVSSLRPRMVGRDHEYQLITRDLMCNDCRIFGRAFDEAELGVAMLERAHNIIRIADRHLHLDQRIALSVSHQMTREPITRDGLAGMDVQCSPLHVAKLAHFESGGCGSRQDAARFFEQQPTGRGQLNVPANPVEQLDLKLIFKRRNRVACRRLRKIEITRGVCEVLAFGHSHKDLELIEGHRKAVARRVVPMLPHLLDLTLKHAMGLRRRIALARTAQRPWKT
jgi:hypothetical protein